MNIIFIKVFKINLIYIFILFNNIFIFDWCNVRYIQLYLLCTNEWIVYSKNKNIKMFTAKKLTFFKKIRILNIINKMTTNLDTLIHTLERFEGIDPRSTDVFGMNYINDIYEAHTYKRFIKIIPLEKTIALTDYNKKDDFALVANIVLDNEIHSSGKKEGTKKRQTGIQFVPTIPIKDFKEDCEYLYIFTVNGQIVKIGGTRTGLFGRTQSYLCGHHITERGNSGDCSKTNGFIYNTFEFYLKLGCKIEMYGLKIPNMFVESTLFGETHQVRSFVFNFWEAKAIEEFNRDYHFFPFLSDNCDPRYRNDTKTVKPRTKKEKIVV